MTRIEDARIPDTTWELLERRAIESPYRPAYLYRDSRGHWVSVDWASMHQHVSHVAAALARVNVTRGVYVGILLPTTPLWELIANALRRNAAVVVGLDIHAGPETIADIINDCRVSLVVTDTARIESIPPRVITVVVDPLVGQHSENVYQLDSLVRESKLHDGASSQPPRPEGSDIAAVIYTSGTTGEAKGIPYRHEQIMAGCRALVSAYEELGPEDRTVCWLPFSALFQRMVNLVSTACGMTTYYVEEPYSIFDRICEIRPTFFVGVPRFFEKLEAALVQAPTSPLRDSLRSVKYMVSGSAPLPMDVLKSLNSMGITVLEAYGLSENTVPLAVNRLKDHRFGSVGKPLAPNEVVLAEDGEVLVRGVGVFAGYLGQTSNDVPVANRESFTDDDFYRTGDLGRFDEEGFLHLTGRKRELIKTSTGRRIAPAKIEAVYGRCPSVDQAIVIGDGRKYLTALLTLRPNAAGRWLGPTVSNPLSADQDRIGEETLVCELFSELETAGRSLAAEEQIHSFGILPRPLVVGEEITTSQKLRRSFIADRYATLINRLYDHTPPCILFASSDEVCKTN